LSASLFETPPGGDGQPSSLFGAFSHGIHRTLCFDEPAFGTMCCFVFCGLFSNHSFCQKNTTVLPDTASTTLLASSAFATDPLLAPPPTAGSEKNAFLGSGRHVPATPPQPDTTSGWDPHVHRVFVTEAGDEAFEPYVAALSATVALFPEAVSAVPRTMQPPLASVFDQAVNALIGVPSTLFLADSAMPWKLTASLDARLHGALFFLFFFWFFVCFL
jgi:hypothetical protein